MGQLWVSPKASGLRPGLQRLVIVSIHARKAERHGVAETVRLARTAQPRAGSVHRGGGGHVLACPFLPGKTPEPPGEPHPRLRGNPMRRETCIWRQPGAPGCRLAFVILPSRGRSGMGGPDPRLAVVIAPHGRRGQRVKGNHATRVT